MKHRTALLVALAVGLLVAFLMVGRARASEPPGIAAFPTVGSSWQHQRDGPIDVTVAAGVSEVDTVLNQLPAVSPRGRAQPSHVAGVPR